MPHAWPQPPQFSGYDCVLRQPLEQQALDASPTLALAAGCMAAVVHDALRRVSPTVSLYVNDYNTVRRFIGAQLPSVF